MNKNLDNNYYDLIINNTSVPMYENGTNITLLNERHSLVHVPANEADRCDLGLNPYHMFPSLYTPESTMSIEKSGIGSVQRNSYLNLMGKGVLIGVVDTGIEYTHTAFLDGEGYSRIYSMWDQTDQTGSPPEEFTFGSEYSRDQINEALKSNDPYTLIPTTDTNGHGTAIASIIAGSKSKDLIFSGVVPESDLVVVKLKEAKHNLKKIFSLPENAYCFQESDIDLGVRYLLTISQRLDRPIMICIAMGSSQGGHDGLGALSSYINSKAQFPGIGFIVSAGNEGNKGRHYYNNTSTEPYYHDFELKIGENDNHFFLEIWPDTPTRISIDISSPVRESTQRIYPTIRECRTFNFIFTQSNLWVNNILFEEETGNQTILIRFENPMPGIWSFRAQSLRNDPFSFHCWLPSGDLISNNTYFLNPDPSTTITSPGNDSHQLTVSAYNQLNDSILAESSRGYSRNGLIKPDLASPGYKIPCAIVGNQYGSLTGTGAAAAHTCGAAAMLMEWGNVRGNYPTLTGFDINRMLIRATQHKTGETYPNNLWGYGQLMISNVFKRLSNV